MLAKPDSPHKKKRGRKPLHPDLRALRQAKSRPPLPPPPRHAPQLRPARDEPRPGVKKPLQPASFTYTGLSRTCRDEAASGSSFSHASASKAGSLGCVWTNRPLSVSSPSSSSHVKSSPSPQSKNSLSELKRSNSDSSSGRFKASPLKQGGGSGSLGLHGSFSGGPSSIHRSPLGQRRMEGAGAHVALVQHKQHNSGLSSAAARDQASQALSLRALNLQSVSGLQGHGMGGAARPGSCSGAVASGTRAAAGGPRAAEPREDRGKETLAGSGRQEERKHGLGLQNRSLNELSTGDSDESSSSSSGGESEPGASLYPHNSRPSFGINATESDTETDWRPARSLLEHVFVTDVTANFVTVTVKESPTSVGFFSKSH